MSTVQHIIFCKSARDCTEKKAQVGNAASANVDYVGEKEMVPASLYSLLWSMRKQRVPSRNKSRHEPLRWKVCNKTKLDFVNFMGFREF